MKFLKQKPFLHSYAMAAWKETASKQWQATASRSLKTSFEQFPFSPGCLWPRNRSCTLSAFLCVSVATMSMCGLRIYRSVGEKIECASRVSVAFKVALSSLALRLEHSTESVSLDLFHPFNKLSRISSVWKYLLVCKMGSLCSQCIRGLQKVCGKMKLKIILFWYQKELESMHDVFHSMYFHEL